MTIKCPDCGKTVLYIDLRRHEPKCANNHNLGMWIMCGSSTEAHVYLKPTQGTVCPICGSGGGQEMNQGIKVRCMHVSQTGKPCIQPRFTWLVDGPPCYMNHMDVIAVTKE